MSEPSPRARGPSRLAALVLVGLAATAAAAAATSPLIGMRAPDFALKGTDGTNRRLSEYRGRVVLLDFYARWAGDSRVEMPALDRIETTYRRAGLVVLAVSVDPDLARAAQFAAAMHVNYPVLLGAGSRIGRAYALERLPETVLVDRSGIVRFVKTGYDRGDDRQFVGEIRALLRE